MNEKPNLCRTAAGNAKSGKCSAADSIRPFVYVRTTFDFDMGVMIMTDCQYFSSGKTADRCKWLIEEVRAFRICKCDEAILSSAVERRMEEL